MESHTLRACQTSCLLSAGDHADRLGPVYKLCELLDSMLDMAPLRQSALIVLAVSAELIPRLWYGALKV